MPQFGKFNVSVVVDGEALPEYGTTADEATKTIACWIPSQEDKVSFRSTFQLDWAQHYNNFQAFSVDFKSGIYPTALKAAVMVDGDWIRSQLIRPPQTLPLHFAEFVTSPTNSRELLFSHIELTGITALTNQFPRFEHFPIDDDAFLSNNVKVWGRLAYVFGKAPLGNLAASQLRRSQRRRYTNARRKRWATKSSMSWHSRLPNAHP